MKVFKYNKENLNRKTLKSERLKIFNSFIFGKITYNEYVSQRNELELKFKLVV